MVIREQARTVATDDDHADQLLVEQDRNTEYGAVTDDLLRSIRVLGIVEYIRDLNGLTGQCDAAGHARPIPRVWIPSGKFV